ncbi:hypothetical protein GDO78_007653 [Eleutherodactylus coqui]|uniref:Uncharacterized protein n=1 Tax=Eleutherodactylus coqui TaxID=57060 RepID=A0A8J6FH88_ELECQ|nr:hypothetical protein GDO78_007653 [Eleutherodactylus coqui]
MERRCVPDAFQRTSEVLWTLSIKNTPKLYAVFVILVSAKKTRIFLEYLLALYIVFYIIHSHLRCFYATCCIMIVVSDCTADSVTIK